MVGITDQITALCCLIGEAVCKVQLLEDALSTSITLKREVKNPRTMSLEKANEYREEHRSNTLGSAVKLTGKETLLPQPLQEALESFVLERNWLVHKSIQDEHGMLSEPNKNRIKAIGDKAHVLQRAVEEDLIEYSSSIGLDMSGVRAAIQKHYEKA